jgi:hypothetical protein
MRCPNCREYGPDGGAECLACGLIFAKWKEKSSRRAAVPAALGDAARPAEDDAPLTPRQTVLVPAAVFACAEVLVHLKWGNFLISAGLSMQVHEFGHALANWLGGRPALPIPMLTIAFSRDRAWWLVLPIAAGLVYAAKAAWEDGCRALAGLCAVLLLVQAWLTLIASPDSLDFIVAFGGLGGECYLAALLVIAYFHRLPRAWRWPSYRTVVLFIGACVLALSLKRWRDADADFMNVPWGSFTGGDGDVENMLAAGWTVNKLVAVYLRLVWVCVGASVFEYLRAAWAARGEIAKVTR